MTDQEYIALIALAQTPKVGPIIAKNLVSYCGGILEIFREKPQHLRKIPSVGDLIAKNIGLADFNAAEKEYKWIIKSEITPICYLESGYPSRFLPIESSPIIFYFKGNADLNPPRTVGIVGTRQPSIYGQSQCENIISSLKKYNVSIISGLAYGIDGLAHKKCVEIEIPTVGILGHGLDIIYPNQHTALAHKMMKNGGILSEFVSGTKPDRENFPMRNRLIAALCDVVIIIESKAQGGSIITVEFANDFNKDVFALPGNVTESLSEGCNKLIKQNKAHLLESADDVGYIMRWDELDTKKPVQKQLFVEMNESESALYDLLKLEKEMTIDRISYSLQKTPSETSSLLLEMEFKGLVRPLPGKKFILA